MTLPIFFFVGAALLISYLTIAYNAGTYLAAALLGYRVRRLSVGTGPPLLRFTIGHTEFQFALIPFMGYVQLHGMNPYEYVEPDDRNSYANGSLLGRMLTVCAGPLGMLAAGFCMFALAAVLGFRVPDGPFGVVSTTGSADAALDAGDRVLLIDGAPVTDSNTAVDRLSTLRGNELVLTIERNRRSKEVRLRPNASGDDQGRFGITLGKTFVERAVSVREAPLIALARMRETVLSVVASLATLVSGGNFTAPPTFPPTTLREFRGVRSALALAGILATYMGLFNLLPFPALNGGRLAFLFYEALTRRKPNARMEATLHTLGLGLLVALIVAVTAVNLFGGKGSEDHLPPAAAAIPTERLRDDIESFRRAKRINERLGLREPTLSI